MKRNVAHLIDEARKRPLGHAELRELAKAYRMGTYDVIRLLRRHDLLPPHYAEVAAKTWLELYRDLPYRTVERYGKKAVLAWSAWIAAFAKAAVERGYHAPLELAQYLREARPSLAKVPVAVEQALRAIGVQGGQQGEA